MYGSDHGVRDGVPRWLFALSDKATLWLYVLWSAAFFTISALSNAGSDRPEWSMSPWLAVPYFGLIWWSALRMAVIKRGRDRAWHDAGSVTFLAIQGFLLIAFAPDFFGGIGGVALTPWFWFFLILCAAKCP